MRTLVAGLSAMRDSFKSWVGQNLLTILVYVTALVLWGARLEAKVDAKADVNTLNAMAVDVKEIRTEVRATNATMRILVCRDPRNVNDTACQGSP